MTRLDRADAAIAGALALAAFVLQLAVLTAGPVYSDEGLVLQTAAEITRGKVLFRDIISPLPGPAAFYLLAGVFELTGRSFGASRLLMAAMSSAVAGLVYLLARRATGRAVAVLAGLAFIACRAWAYPHWLFFHYASCAAFLVAVAYALVAVALAGGRRAPAFLGGAAAGLAMLAKQDAGGLGLAGIGLAALLLGRPRLALAGAVASGAALVVSAALLALAMAGALGAFWDQGVRTAFRGFLEFPYLPRPAPWPLLAQDAFLRSRLGEYSPSVAHALYWDALTSSWIFRETALYDAALKLVFWAPVAVLAAGALMVGMGWRRGAADEARRRQASLLLIYALVAQAAFNPPHDWLHLLILYHPTILVGAVVIDGVARALGPAGRRLLLSLVAAAVLALVLLAVRVTRDFARHYDEPVATAAGTVHVSDADAPVLRGLLGHVEAHAAPGDALPVIPYYPLVAFLADRTTGTSNFYFWPVRAAGDTDARLIDDLRRTSPPVIVYSPSQYAHLRRFGENFPDLFRYLVDHYDVTRTFSPASPWGIVFCALGPKAPDAPPLVDLAARLDEAAVTVPGAGGPKVVAAPERTLVAGRALWPFRRVVYQRPAVGAPSTIGFRLRVPASATLRFGYGFNPDAWISFTPAAVTLTVGVTAASEPERTVFSATVDAQRRPEDRRWHEAAVDLRGHAEQDVTVAFYAVTDGPAGERSDLVGWAEPRLVAGRPTGP